MKKTLKFLALAIVSLFVMPAMTALAQEMPQMPQLPLDPQVRKGVLPNGLTYYIRHNEKPKGQADFYIAQKVGSILEEDHQRGLAHFLEHMCFNGSENFPGNGMISWLETVGVKFGQNLNAYTAIDETVYNIANVPVARKSVQDSCLLILHDWADGLLLEPDEIDKERGVIHEEWRSRNKGSQRILEQILPALYPGLKYGYRLPIGTMEVVDNFKPQALRDYYEAWYRPDLQGIVVVGDIDVDYIEGKIKEIFSPIKMPKNAKERVYPAVPDYNKTVYGIGHDKEMNVNVIEMSWLSDPLPQELRNTQIYYMTQYMQSMISMMLNNRFNEITSKPDAPFAQADVNFGGFLVSSRVKDAFSLSVVAKDENLEPAFAAAYREVLRAARGGFNQSELTRARDEYLSSIERAYNNRASIESGTFVNQYVRNFLDGDPAPGIETVYTMMNQMAPMIPLEAMNQALAETVAGQSRAVLVMQPDNEKNVYATEQGIDAAIKKVDAENIEAFVDNAKTEPLIEKLPAPGKIVSESKNDNWGTTEYVLSNGVRVILKQTKFKEDEILMEAQALDGYAAMCPRNGEKPAELASIKLLPYSADNFSLGSYTSNDLSKYLAGKQVGMGFSMGAYTREINGSTTPKDLKTLMELVYSAFTGLSYDAEEFKAFQSQMSAMLATQTKTPDYKFSKMLMENLFKSPMRQALTAEDVTAATAEGTTKVMKALTNNAADYTFVFVGNIDEAAFRPLVEQYIATLPANPAFSIKQVEEYNAADFITPGDANVTMATKMEQPTTYVAVFQTANMPVNPKNQRMAEIIGQVLTKRLLKTVREEMGAVYSIGANGGESSMGPMNVNLQSAFPMKPEMKEQVLKVVADEFNAIGNDLTEAELSDIRNFMVKEAKENLEKNNGWLNGITGWLIHGNDAFTTRVATLEGITVDDVKAYAKAVMAQKNYKVLILEPEK